VKEQKTSTTGHFRYPVNGRAPRSRINCNIFETALSGGWRTNVVSSWHRWTGQINWPRKCLVMV